MTNYEDFKRKLLERSEDGHIKEGFILQIDGNAVYYVDIRYNLSGEQYVFCSYLTQRFSDNIYQYEVDENNEYQIEWFILEKDDAKPTHNKTSV